jgi:hypothetical protein
MYDEAAVETLLEVRRLIGQLGLAYQFRKMHGILNAIEIQIEDGEYRPEAIVRLGEALYETAEFYGVDSAAKSHLAQEFETFMRKLQEIKANGPR